MVEEIQRAEIQVGNNNGEQANLITYSDETLQLIESMKLQPGFDPLNRFIARETRGIKNDTTNNSRRKVN